MRSKKTLSLKESRQLHAFVVQMMCTLVFLLKKRRQVIILQVGVNQTWNPFILKSFVQLKSVFPLLALQKVNHLLLLVLHLGKV